MGMSFDEAIDHLYSGTAEEFVARRAKLAAELSRQGKKAEAADIKKRRRPSVAAAAVNAVVRSHPDEIHALGAAGDRMHAAQAAALAGRGAEDLRAASRLRNELVDRLTDATIAVLATSSPQPESYRSAIADTFEAATLDSEARALVESGALVKELSVPSGLSPQDVDAPLPSKPAKAKPTKGRATAPPATASRPNARDDVEAARARRAQAKAALTEARRAEREARRVAERDDAAAMRARAAADEAVRSVAELEEHLATARAAEREARSAARLADQTARTSATRAARATARVEALEPE